MLVHGVPVNKKKDYMRFSVRFKGWRFGICWSVTKKIGFDNMYYDGNHYAEKEMADRLLELRKQGILKD